MCTGYGPKDPKGGKGQRQRTPYGHRYPETERGPIQRGGTGGVQQPARRPRLYFRRLAELVIGGRRVWA